jgi:phenylpropionate dioxygenase-like ring-hydroxylating dioxygenase large terminal subunit
MGVTLNSATEADPDDGFGLPAWTYWDPEFFAVEMERVIRPSWQIVCHESDVRNPGEWHTLEYLGESVAVVRGSDSKLRAFANVCRHRGSRLLDGTSGCARTIVCPYHAWTYNLDGSLRGIPQAETYARLDLTKIRLAAVEIELFQGFVFVRLEPGSPSVSEMLAPWLSDIEPYRFDELQALGRVTYRPRNVNWKNIGDNYSDALHVPLAHPGLKRLFGDGYGVESAEWSDKMWGRISAAPSNGPSELAYQSFLPHVAHLPPERQRIWTYFKLWPNIAFDIYPDQIDFMQWLPVSPTETLIREIAYVIPDERREMRAARYLNWRVNRRVNAEDTKLVMRVQKGMQSRSFTAGPLAETETALRNFCRRMRALIPQARLAQAPPPGWSRG